MLRAMTSVLMSLVPGVFWAEPLPPLLPPPQAAATMLTTTAVTTSAPLEPVNGFLVLIECPFWGVRSVADGARANRRERDVRCLENTFDVVGLVGRRQEPVVPRVDQRAALGGGRGEHHCSFEVRVTDEAQVGHLHRSGLPDLNAVGRRLVCEAVTQHLPGRLH